jgi:hypothetical protein
LTANTSLAWQYHGKEDSRELVSVSNLVYDMRFVAASIRPESLGGVFLDQQLHDSDCSHSQHSYTLPRIIRGLMDVLKEDDGVYASALICVEFIVE